jgi:hypothetical protein
MRRWRKMTCLMVALSTCAAAPAQAFPGASKANAAVERKVERRYSRTVVAFCHKRRNRPQFFCEYIILGNMEDGIRAGEEGRNDPVVGEGDAQVDVEGSRLTVRLLGPPVRR